MPHFCRKWYFVSPPADAARLRALVDALPARERAIMRQRYGFDGAPKTQQQTAQALHISRSYVSRLEKRKFP